MNILKCLASLSLIVTLNISVFSQHNQENIDYIRQKEIELTNDSSYWDNAFVFYTGFNRVNLI